MKNQLIMTCAALLCLSCVEEVTGNLPVPPIQMPVGKPTAIGTPIRDIITQEIGPNGGIIQWDSGTYHLVFPPDALDKSMMKSSMTWPSHTEMTINHTRFHPDKPGQVVASEKQ